MNELLARSKYECEYECKSVDVLHPSFDSHVKKRMESVESERKPNKQTEKLVHPIKLSI